MKSKEGLWHQFVCDYDIDVPESAIENELQAIKQDMRHRMRYQQMSGGEMHLFPDQELAEQEAELRELALFEAKEPKVLKDIIARQDLTTTPEELQAEAEALAEREHSTLDMVKRFFGEDFSLLERDVLNAKAQAWALNQMEDAQGK